MGKVIQMADIITLMFKSGAAALAQMFQNIGDIAKSVAKDKIVTGLQKRFFPIVLPLGIFAGQRMQGKVLLTLVGGAAVFERAD